MTENIKIVTRYRVNVLNQNFIEPKRSNKKKTTEQYREELKEKNPNIEVLEEYINAKTQILHKYKSCGHIKKIAPTKILTGSGCDYCNRKKAGERNKKTDEQYEYELKIKNPNIEPLETYKGVNKKILHRYSDCGHERYVTPASALQGSGCPTCSLQKQRESKKKPHDKFVKEVYLLNQSIKIISKYNGNKNRIDCECLVCNHMWSPFAGDLLCGKGCPKCAGNMKLSHSEFMEKFKNVGNRDIEIMDIYLNAKTHIKCLCKICGYEFSAVPYNLLRGSGCTKCKNKINGEKLRKSHDKFLQEVCDANKNIKILGEYKSSKERIKVECLICHYEWSPFACSILEGHGCPKCANRITFTHEEFIDKCKSSSINKNIEIIGRYTDSHTKVDCKCNICGNIFGLFSFQIYNGVSCKVCSDKQTGINKRRNHNDFVNKVNDINPYINIIGEYTTSANRISCQCKICSNIWNPIADTLLRNCGCPKCNMSHLERFTSQILDEYNIHYTRPKSYDGLVGTSGRLLSYDFYLPHYNLLIECQGEQHERPVEHFGGEKQFEKQQEHDVRKREYAKQNNINLLEIWYYDIDNIEEILTNKLNNLKLECLETAISA